MLSWAVIYNTVMLNELNYLPLTDFSMKYLNICAKSAKSPSEMVQWRPINEQITYKWDKN